MWLKLLFMLAPEIIRGAIGIVRDRLAQRRAEADAKKAEDERKKAEAEQTRHAQPVVLSHKDKQAS